MFKILSSEKGLGLVHVIASLIIVSAAIIGLVYASFYAKKTATENYHYRAALLIASDKMEQIKYHNRNNQRQTAVNIAGISGPVVLDERDGNPLWAQVLPPTRSLKKDDHLPLYVVYDRISITVQWEEDPDVLLNPQSQTKESVTLHEDYFRKVSDE